MRKEVTIAIFAGLAIGLTMAFGFYRINSKNQASSVAEPTNNNEIPLDPDKNTTNTGLTLTNMDDGDIYTDSPISISGISEPGSSILISTQSEDFIKQSNNDGTFSESIKLNKGINKIIVESLDENGVKLGSITNTVIYYPDFETDLNGS